MSVSIIICTYNGSSRIEHVLQTILNLNKIDHYELIIVDNKSSDNTQLICQEILSKSFIDYTIITEFNQGLSYARLRGLKEAKYDIVLFCDDDNYLDPDYLRIGYDLMNKHNDVGALGGCGYPVFESPPPQWFEKYSYSFAVGAQAEKTGYLTEIPAELYGAGCYFRKKIILDFYDKGFIPIMSDRKGESLVSGGDVEWCYWVQLAGYRLYYDDRLKFGHLMPASRLNWDYYLKLKKGISSGSAKLLSYALFFKNPNSAAVSFIKKYIQNYIKYIILYLIIFFRYKFLNRKFTLKERELALINLSARVSSYYDNFFISLNHFNQLKRKLNLLKS